MASPRVLGSEPLTVLAVCLTLQPTGKTRKFDVHARYACMNIKFLTFIANW
jgi:hypothetical protein